jgi:hypothetical protein
VPFADCLNHSNVQTKYDFDEDSNGVFRLFPTGANRYGSGQEAFNSYGRRSNANLLLDYGFALPDNEWDAVELEAHIEPHGFGSLPLRTRTLILRSGVSLTRHTVSRGHFCWELLRFYRIAGWEPAEVEKALAGRVDAYKPLNLAQEITALKAMHACLTHAQARLPTSLAHDQALLKRLHAGFGAGDAKGVEAEVGVDPGRLVSAVTYRMTRKMILAGQAALVETVLSLAEVMQVQRARAGPGDASAGGASKEEEKGARRHVSFLTDRLPSCEDHDRLSAYVTALSELPVTVTDGERATPPRHGEEKGLSLSLQGRVTAPPPLTLPPTKVLDSKAPPKDKDGGAVEKGGDWGKGSKGCGGKGGDESDDEDVKSLEEVVFEEKEGKSSAPTTKTAPAPNANPFIPPPLRVGSP